MDGIGAAWFWDHPSANVVAYQPLDDHSQAHPWRTYVLTAPPHDLLADSLYDPAHTAP